jgi:hypothetical protein
MDGVIFPAKFVRESFQEDIPAVDCRNDDCEAVEAQRGKHLDDSVFRS